MRWPRPKCRPRGEPSPPGIATDGSAKPSGNEPMRFTIKQKLASIFAAIILLSGVAAWVGTNSLATIDDNVKALLSGPVPAGEDQRYRDYLLEHDENDKNVIIADRREMTQSTSRKGRVELRGELLNKIGGLLDISSWRRTARNSTSCVSLSRNTYRYKKKS